MLARLIQVSLAQRLFVLIITLIVTGAGWYAHHGLPIDAFLNVSSTQVKITMKAPGMMPGEGAAHYYLRSDNVRHQREAIFKAFGRALRMSAKRDTRSAKPLHRPSS